MEFKELKKLIALMNENGLVELEISEEGRRCVLKKAPPWGGNHELSQMAMPSPHQNG